MPRLAPALARVTPRPSPRAGVHRARAGVGKRAGARDADNASPTEARERGRARRMGRDEDARAVRGERGRSRHAKRLREARRAAAADALARHVLVAGEPGTMGR